MRKLYLLFLILSIHAYDTHSQQPVHRVSKSYFRSDPFSTSFGAFVQHLLNDPAITGKKVERKTDSTFFSFEGTYSSFNPFFSKPDKIDVVLIEFSTSVNDSLPPDTLYSYQLIAFYADDKDGEKTVKKEFERIDKRIKSYFAGSNTEDNPGGVEGKLYNYFVPYHLLAPFSLGWYRHVESKQLYLVLTLRLKPIENETQMPYFIVR